MLETHIKILASFYTAILIAAVASLLVFGGFKFKTHSVKGKVISATMIDISQLQPKKKLPIKNETSNKPPPKKAETKKQTVKPVEPVKKEVPKKKPPEIVKETPKVDVKAQEMARKKQLQREKLKKEIQRKKLENKKRLEQAEQDLKDLANKVKNEEREPVENIGSEKGTVEADERNQLMARYQMAVISKVQKQWNKPATANSNLLCYVKVTQIPGGGVIDATISTPCNANAIVKKSIIAAINKADPLPYKGFERVFDRTAIFRFQPKK